MATDLSDTIGTAALTPQSASGDMGSVQARSLGDLIAADRYLAARAGSKLPHRGLRFSKIVGPAQCPADAAVSDLQDGSFA